ncbi:hypothetical protein D3C80_1500640 [compost metagenome]
MTGRNPIRYPARNSLSLLLHLLDRRDKPNGVPQLERAELPIEAPAHSPVDIGDGIGYDTDLRR